MSATDKSADSTTDSSGRPAKYVPSNATYVGPDDARFAEMLDVLFPGGFATLNHAAEAAEICSLILTDQVAQKLDDLSKYKRTSALCTVLYPGDRVQNADHPASALTCYVVADKLIGVEEVIDVILVHGGLCLRFDEVSGNDGLPPHLATFFALLKQRVEQKFRTQTTGIIAIPEHMRQLPYTLDLTVLTTDDERDYLRGESTSPLTKVDFDRRYFGPDA